MLKEGVGEGRGAHCILSYSDIQIYGIQTQRGMRQG